MRRNRFRWILLFLAASLACADEVDDIIKSAMAEQHTPGLALAVMKDGKVIRRGGYGLANVELNVPVTSDTVFKIGSVSKQFIASGVMILAQEHRLEVGDSVRKFLNDAPDAWSDITLRRLLSHTAGLVPEGPAFQSLKIQPDMQVIRSGYPVALAFGPGERWQYSNLGFFTLAEIVTRVSGESWSNFAAERIFRPQHMDATRTTTVSDIVSNRADGYTWRTGKLQRADEYLALRPSGAFLSTVNDLAKWDAALYTEMPLTSASREQMWTAVPLNDGSSSAYGFGWEVQQRGGRRCVHHGGALPGFRAYFARFPEERLSFAVLTNGNEALPAVILWKVAAVWLPGVDQAPANGRVQK
jgi:CubicO group peptidase (beta-lactamase class C family)